jgi:hypothetical protein
MDELILDPEACGFDPFSGFDTSDLCFSESQAMALERIYHGTTDPVTGDTLYRKFFPGSELYLFFQTEGIVNTNYTEVLLQNLWNKKLSYNGLTEFNFHSDLPSYNQVVDGALDNDSPDISDFI